MNIKYSLVIPCFNEEKSLEVLLHQLVVVVERLNNDVSAISLDKFFAVGTEDEFNTYKYYSTFKMSRNFRFEV